MLIHASISEEERRELKRLALVQRTTLTDLVGKIVRDFIAESRDESAGDAVSAGSTS